MEVCTDHHLDPYYGDEEETEALYSSKAKRGTTSFQAYATLYVRVRNKRDTLAVRQLTAGETTGDVLGELLELLDGLDLGVKAVYLDRGFYNSTCLNLLYAYNYAYVVPIIKWGETIQDELNSGRSREIEHELAGKVTFSVFIDCVYQRGRYDEHRVARHGYAADAPFIWRRRDAAAATSESGRSSNFARWCSEQRGQCLAFVDPFQRINHWMSGSSGSCRQCGRRS